MSSRRSLVLVLTLAGALGGCVSTAERKAAAPDAHNSRNALDWAGAYEGVLPCADCPGIKTRLVLHADGHFELTTQYLERSAEMPTVHGRFLWNDAGSVVMLDAAGSHRYFRVGEGRLSQLQADGKPWPPGAAPRVLMQLPPP